MESHWSVSACFVLSSDAESFDFQRITGILGFQPTKARKRSEYLCPAVASSEWYYRMPRQNTHSTETEMEKLQKLIEPHIDELKGFCMEQGIRSRFVISVRSADDSLPGIEATTGFVKFMANLGADICFDIYCCLGDQFIAEG